MREDRASQLAVISTGGTIEKTYDPTSGLLANQISVLDLILDGLELVATRIERVALMNKDSVDMTDEDHASIARVAQERARTADGVVVVHGTDTLEISGERTLGLGAPAAPIVFTGAMRPYVLRTTDAVQNLTEALLAARLLSPGVYVAMHGRVLRFPGVRKDRAAQTFVPS